MTDKSPPSEIIAELGPLQDKTAFDHQLGGTEQDNFTCVKWLGRFRPQTHSQAGLRNNLRKAVGLLEVANLGDVAANIWNTIPIPTYIVIFMILGGLIAFFMLYYAISDARRSWRNIQGLRLERRRLREAQQRTNCGPDRKSIDSFLFINLRELGSEVVDRFGMVLLLGLGAFLVGIGTFMAPAGANRRVFEASNYLTGHVGNAPCAIYGLLNVGWAFFVCARAYGHRRATEQLLKDDTILPMLKKRTTRIYFHGILNGITVLAAGAAAMLTATQRFAYPALVPCCVSSFYLNWYWRNKIGYDRPFQGEGTMVSVSETSLCDAITVTIRHHQALGSSDLDISSVMKYIVRHNLSEEFCLQVLNDSRLKKILIPEGCKSRSIDIKPHLLVSQVAKVNVDDAVHVGKAARQVAIRFCRYRERWLLETLGCHMAILEQRQERECPGGEDTKLTGSTDSTPYPSEPGTPSFRYDVRDDVEMHSGRPNGFEKSMFTRIGWFTVV